ncbi:hypothetical protein D3C87_804290 [compost metagenome]
MPSPATRTVLKMPDAMPARSRGTTLTARPSISPQGRPMPAPISSSGPTRPCKGVPGAQRASHTSPAAHTRSPTAEITPAENRCASHAASVGTMRIGPDSANMKPPASSALRPSSPMKRIGSSTSSTTKP